jgi:exopolysaccharide production protein ExoQ
MVSTSVGKADCTQRQSMRHADYVLKYRTLLEGALFAFLWMVFVGLHPPAVFGIDALDPDAPLDGGAGDIVLQLAYVMLFGITVCTGYNARKHLRFNFLPPAILALPLLWCWVSVTWAASLSVGIRRVAFTTIIVLLAVYLTRSIGQRRAFLVLYWACAIVLIGGYIALLSPGAYQEGTPLEPGGGWRGLQLHKNNTGPICVVSALVFLQAYRTGLYKLASAALFAGAVFYLWGTMSKTSFGLLPVSITLGFLVAFASHRPLLRAILNISLILAAILIPLVLYDDAMRWVAALDVDGDAFTGRGMIWNVVTKYISDHMLLGSGYGVFWGVGDTSPLNAYGSGWVFNLAIAHNGYLDLWAQTGLIGLLIFLSCLLVVPLYLLVNNRSLMDYQKQFLASVFIFAFLHNFLESSFYQRDHPLWAVFVIAVTIIVENKQFGRSPPRMTAASGSNTPIPVAAKTLPTA